MVFRFEYLVWTNLTVEMDRKSVSPFHTCFFYYFVVLDPTNKKALRVQIMNVRAK
jgi:hypothetical protein